MADFYFTKGKDVLKGTDAAGDVFTISPGTFSDPGTDVFKGGGGLGDPVDTLIVAGGPYPNSLVITNNYLSVYSPVLADPYSSGIEVVKLEAAIPGLSLGRDIIDQSSNGRFDLYGSAGDDTVQIILGGSYFYKPKSTQFVFHGGEGNDILRQDNYTIPGNRDELYGEGGNDTLIAAAKLIDGGSGDDFVSSYLYKADLFGGDGNDFVGCFEGGKAFGGNGDDIMGVGLFYGATAPSGAIATIDGGEGYDRVAADVALLPFIHTVSIEGMAINRITLTNAEMSYLAGYDSIAVYNGETTMSFHLKDGGIYDFSALPIEAQRLQIDFVDDAPPASGPNIITGALNIGNDINCSHYAAVTIIGGNQDDDISSGIYDDVIRAGAGNDRLVCSYGKDIVDGGSGDDTFDRCGAAIESQLLGGTGADSFILSSSARFKGGTIDGGDGTDTLLIEYDLPATLVFSNIEILKPTSFTVELSIAQINQFEAFDNRVTRGDAPRHLYLSGNGTIDIGEKLIGADRVVLTLKSMQSATVTTTDGNDEVHQYTKGRVEVHAGLGNDSVHMSYTQGSVSPSVVYGEGGNDFMAAPVDLRNRRDVANLVLDGGKGNDQFWGYAERMNGGDGDDVFHGAATRIDGGTGFDVLYSSSDLAKPIIKSVSGIERLVVVEDAIIQSLVISQVDELIGRRGHHGRLDLQILSGEHFSLTDLTQSVSLFTSFEDKAGLDGVLTNFDDVFRGGVFGSTIDGADGNDDLEGGDGKDILVGGAGDDEIVADDGDRASGGRGNDKLYAGSGHSVLEGGAGRDMLYCIGGNNTLDGGAGNDRVLGGGQSDIMTGGSGYDLFRCFVPTKQSVFDTITDFSLSHDVIGFTAAQTGSIGRDHGFGLLENFRFQASRSAVARDPGIRFIYDKDDGHLYFDADGSAKAHDAILVAILEGAPALTAQGIAVFGEDFAY